jgi:hypothetical protein
LGSFSEVISHDIKLFLLGVWGASFVSMADYPKCFNCGKLLRFRDGTLSHHYDIGIRFSFVKYTECVLFSGSSNGGLIIVYIIDSGWREFIDTSSDIKDGEGGDVAT